MNKGDSNFNPNVNNRHPMQNNIREDIPNNIALAIFSLICCFMPFGIVSLVYSMSVNSNLASGNIVAARKASATSKKWAIAAIATSLVFYLLAFAFISFMFLLAVASELSPEVAPDPYYYY